MNLYHCMVELKSPDRALQFAAAADAWLGHLKSENIITDWRLLRRKFGLASGQHTDFLIEIEVDGLDQLREVIAEGADVVLFDNMTPEQMAEGVKMIGGRMRTEASYSGTASAIRPDSNSIWPFSS